MAVTVYDPAKIINRIIDNLKLDTAIYDAKGADDKIRNILFGDPPGQKWLVQERPYIAVAPGEPFELLDESTYVAKQGEQSPRTIITLQFFITCAVDGDTQEKALAKDLPFRILLKQFFKNNPKMSKAADDSDPLFHRSKTIITPKFVRSKFDTTSLFTVILQADIPSE